MRDWREMNKNLFSALKLEKIATFIILSIAILVASFCIICTLLLMVTEKGKEIAILKAVGATDSSILQIFMTEGMIIGGIGTVFGVVTGLVFCLALSVSACGSIPRSITSIACPVAVNAERLRRGRLAALLICTISTIYPARAASHAEAGRRAPLRVGSSFELAGIAFEDVHKSFDHMGRKLEVLRGIDLDIDEGELVAIVGPSGAGKSTLLHCIGTLDLPTSGRIELAGEDITARRVRPAQAGGAAQPHHRVRLPVSSPAARVQRARERDDARAHPGQELDARWSARRARCSTRWGSRAARPTGPASSRAASSSASRWRARWCSRPSCSSPTSPPATSTPRPAAMHELFFEINRSRGTTIVVVTHNAASPSSMPRVIHLRDGKVEKDIRRERGPSPELTAEITV